MYMPPLHNAQICPEMEGGGIIYLNHISSCAVRWISNPPQAVCSLTSEGLRAFDAKLYNHLLRPKAAQLLFNRSFPHLKSGRGLVTDIHQNPALPTPALIGKQQPCLGQGWPRVTRRIVGREHEPLTTLELHQAANRIKLPATSAPEVRNAQRFPFRRQTQQK